MNTETAFCTISSHEPGMISPHLGTLFYYGDNLDS